MRMVGTPSDQLAGRFASAFPNISSASAARGAGGRSPKRRSNSRSPSGRRADPSKNNIERFLKKTGNAPGVIKAAPNQTGDLSTWRSWTTPTLN